MAEWDTRKKARDKIPTPPNDGGMVHPSLVDRRYFFFSSGFSSDAGGFA